MLGENIRVKNIYPLSLIFSFISFAVYVLASTLLPNVGVLHYLSYFFSKLVESVLPILTAAAVFANQKRKRDALLPTLYYALTRLVYVIPYSALTALLGGYGFADGALYVLFEAILYLAVYFLWGIILYFILNFSYRYFSKKSSGSPLPASTLDLDNPLVISILFASLFRFLFNLILELVNTVEYLTDYAGDYRIGEVIYMIFSFVFITALILLSVALTVRMLNKRSYEE